LRVRDFHEAEYLFFTTRLGRVKRVTLAQFQSVRSSGLIAIGLEPKDELAWVRMTSGSDNVVLVTQKGQAIQFKESDVRAMGRPAAGVIGIRLEAKDRVIAFEVVRNEGDLLVVAQKGLGKRTPISQFRSQGRGGKGVTAMRLTPKTGDIVAAAMAEPDDTIMLMNTAGVVIRIPVKQISRIGRATQGVTLMRLGDGEQVASMTVVERKDEPEPQQLGELNGDDVPTKDSNGHAKPKSRSKPQIQPE
jgi:DNA gyrase subunit A